MVEPRKSVGAQRNPASHQAILDAAQDLLREEGLARFSIEAVARRACAGKPTIYRWWPNKASLLLEVYARIKQELVDPDTGTLEGDVAGFLKNLLTFWSRTDAGLLFRSVIAESQNDPEAHQAFVAYHLDRRAHTARLFARVRDGQPTLGAEQAAVLAEVVASTALIRLLTDRLEVDESELTLIARQLVQGLGARSSDQSGGSGAS